MLPQGSATHGSPAFGKQPASAPASSPSFTATWAGCELPPGSDSDLASSWCEQTEILTPNRETKRTPRPPLPASEPAGRRQLEVGMVLGKCLLTKQVGQGGSGQVFRAFHRTLNSPVAVKVLHPEALELEPAVARHLKAEAHWLAQLNHPNIVRVLDFEDSAEFPYLVLEYVEGWSLGELIGQSGRLRADRAVQIMLQVSEGLHAASKLGIVHRDVKPGNILVARDGTAKIGDLGLALVTEESKPPAGGPAGMVGTVAYMSPEQARNAGPVDFRSDIYSLGATFYHAVTGRLPFPGQSRSEVIQKHAVESPTPPHLLVPDLPEAISAVILKMLQKDAAERYQSYADMIADLQVLQSQLGISATESLSASSGNSSSVLRSPTPCSPRRTLWTSLLGLIRGRDG